MRAGGNSVTFHYEVVDDVPGTIAAAREHGLVVGVAFNPERSRRTSRRSGDANIVLHGIHPLLGQSWRRMPSTGSSGRAALPESICVQVDGGIDNDNVRSVYDAGATLIVAAA